VTRRAPVLVLAVALAAGCAAAGPPREPAAVGRVEIVDGREGYIHAVFPQGRTTIFVDKRELWKYAPGDEIAVDSAGRPIPR